MANSPICSIHDCDKATKTLGYCLGHYKRLHKYGDPLAGGIPHGAARDFANITIPAHVSDTCLIWPFGKTAAGYGVIMRGKTTYVHHIACESRNGPRPEGTYAAHSCGDPSCCNPQHLRWATPRENTFDRRLHGTHNDGENNPCCKLTDMDVEGIKALRGMSSVRALAARYGVTPGRINDVLSGRARARKTGHY